MEENKKEGSEGWRKEGKKKKKEKVRDLGVKLESPQTFVYLHLFPPLPSWDHLLWSCPGARSRVNILAIQTTSCQQALPFEQCASRGWMLNCWWPWKQWSSASKFKSTNWNRACRITPWQTRWSEEVSKCWELQIPKSPLVGPQNDAPEADVVARKGSGAPTQRELEATPCNRQQSWVGTWEQNQTGYSGHYIQVLMGFQEGSILHGVCQFRECRVVEGKGTRFGFVCWAPLPPLPSSSPNCLIYNLGAGGGGIKIVPLSLL